MRLNVNSAKLITYTDNLEKLSSKALPYAVRNTLNNAAFDMKKDTLQKSVKTNFKGLKAPQFFKRYSGVRKANGTNINAMESKVGLLDFGNPAARKAIDNMDVQEIGGVITGGFSYLKDARAGSSLNKFVKKANYYDKSKVVSGRSKIGRSKGTNKSKFVARAYRANKENKPMFINSLKGNFLARVTSFKKSKRGKVKIKIKLLMKERESAKIKATHFMEEAGLETRNKIEKIYITEIDKQIKRLQK